MIGEIVVARSVFSETAVSGFELAEPHPSQLEGRRAAYRARGNQWRSNHREGRIATITPFQDRPNNSLTFASRIYARLFSGDLTEGGCMPQASPRRSVTRFALLTVARETKCPVHSQELQSDPLSSLIEQRFHSS
jgi:hypothetical protein